MLNRKSTKHGVMVTLELLSNDSNCQWQRYLSHYTIIEQITTVKQSIKHLVPDLNHLDRVLEDLRSENFLAF